MHNKEESKIQEEDDQNRVWKEKEGKEDQLRGLKKKNEEKIQERRTGKTRIKDESQSTKKND